MSAQVLEIVLAEWRCDDCNVGGGEPMLLQWANRGAADHDAEFHSHTNDEGEDA